MKKFHYLLMIIALISGSFASMQGYRGYSSNESAGGSRVILYSLALGATAYVAGRLYSGYLYNKASNTYETELEQIVALKHNYNDKSEIKKKLKAFLNEQILIQDDEEKNSVSYMLKSWLFKTTDNNFVYLKYGNDINWYINRLWYVQPFNWFTAMSTKNRALREKLVLIKNCNIKKAYNERKESSGNGFQGRRRKSKDSPVMECRLS